MKKLKAKNEKLIINNVIMILMIVLLIDISNQDAVCTEPMLLTELLQDISDNNKLDCLREPLPAPTDHIETEDEKRKRLEAAWDTDCSFEADYDWSTPLKKYYGLRSGLVDRDGVSVANDFSDQADICEIIRALIAGGNIEGYKLDNLNAQVLDSISCPGDESQTQVCAASGGSAMQAYTWYIFLEGTSFGFDNKPKWQLNDKSKTRLGVGTEADS